jgi:hypothetical protein
MPHYLPSHLPLMLRRPRALPMERDLPSMRPVVWC